MLQIAASWLEQEVKDITAAKEAYMAENCATPDLSGDQAALMVKPPKRTDKSSQVKSYREELKTFLFSTGNLQKVVPVARQD